MDFKSNLFFTNVDVPNADDIVVAIGELVRSVVQLHADAVAGRTVHLLVVREDVVDQRQAQRTPARYSERNTLLPSRLKAR